MWQKFKLGREIIRNMGWKYVAFRSLHEIKCRSGWLKRQFPTAPEKEQFISLEEWRKQKAPFFFHSKTQIKGRKNPLDSLEKAYKAISAGQLLFFSAKTIDLKKDYDWLTNPDSGYQYNIQKHWTEVEDFSDKAGDIKYVWEKSRFSFLYTLIRYDYHFDVDSSEQVFAEIDSWIKANPINQGPNYKCSQEISLRVLNWTFALYYYANASALSSERFQRIMHMIYWQLEHVYQNIHFSRIAVRNNHAITETLMLYLGGLLFPFMPGAENWKHKGKTWFEKEISYQIYEDGTFLQFSHNYHRVIIQLLTWAFHLAEYNREQFTPIVYERAQKSLDYLYQCQNIQNGQLPNYGANDGALFFKLNELPYRDYRPQLNALYYYFNHQHLYNDTEVKEDAFWYTAARERTSNPSFAINIQQRETASFSKGGYYTIRDKDSFTFIKCGSYRDRPSHADNLHVDIWFKGENILWDAGSYKYNTSLSDTLYFNGTASHNTVTLDHQDQMLKGPRFIWLYWSEAQRAELNESGDYWFFDGQIHAFKQLGINILHQRHLRKYKEQAKWMIEDVMEHSTDKAMQQRWNISSGFEQQFSIKAVDENGKTLQPIYQKAWYSSLYGIKDERQAILFETRTKKIQTIIQQHQ
ncbi:MAG: alginate lyase family protein [Bacteroidota bacterium]